MTLSWLAFGILVAGAVGFAAWIYVRRELPIPGQRLLGTLRALVLVLVLLLLYGIPGFRPVLWDGMRTALDFIDLITGRTWS